MAIQIHVRVKDSDWDSEHELAELIADKIEALIPIGINISVLVIPVEDQGNEMEPLTK